MSGLSLGVGGGLRAGGSVMSPAVPANQVAPSTAAFGNGGVVPTNPPSSAGTTAGHLAIYAGMAAGALIAISWWSSPESERNTIGKGIFGFGLLYVFFSGIKQWGRVHVAEGDVQGAMGTIYKAAAII